MIPDVAPQDRAPTWVRIGLVALAVPQLFTGIWAVLRPEHWFERFPGLDPRLVAAEPPFNAHLATDAGAGFLATGVVLAGAAMWAHRHGVVLALATYLAFAVPHLAYHAANPAPGLTSAQDAQNVATLAVGVALPVVLLWGVRRRPGPVGDGTEGPDGGSVGRSREAEVAEPR
jgi:hypothetical protein